jgi:trehalose 6-phosphate phosphatase
MKHLFSPEGKAALTEVMRKNPLLVFDFDGTLSPIVSSPDDARVSSSMVRSLHALMEVLPVAVVTGRSLQDVRLRLGFTPQFLIGNHGSEDSISPTVLADASALDVLRGRIRDRAALLRENGISIEDKVYSLAFHYRLAFDRRKALDCIESLTQDHRALGIRVFGGKMVLNAVPQDAPNKADAILNLVKRSKAKSAVFVGDDVNDEPVFALPEPGWLTVRVGCDNPSSRAKFVLNDVGEVDVLLQKMLMEIPPSH